MAKRGINVPWPLPPLLPPLLLLLPSPLPLLPLPLPLLPLVLPPLLLPPPLPLLLAPLLAAGATAAAPCPADCVACTDLRQTDPPHTADAELAGSTTIYYNNDLDMHRHAPSPVSFALSTMNTYLMSAITVRVQKISDMAPSTS